MAKGKLGAAGLKEQLADVAAPPPAASDSAGRTSEPARAKRGPRPLEQRDQPLARDTRVGITIFAPREVRRELKELAAHEETTVQALVLEGVDLMLRARGRHPSGAR